MMRKTTAIDNNIRNQTARYIRDKRHSKSPIEEKRQRAKVTKQSKPRINNARKGGSRVKETDKSRDCTFCRTPCLTPS